MSFPGPDYPAPAPTTTDGGSSPLVPQPAAPADASIPTSDPAGASTPQAVPVPLPDLRRLAGPALVAGGMYVVAFIFSFIVAGLITGKLPADLGLPSGATGKIASFLTSMAFGGSLEGSASATAVASGAAHLTFIPWGITVLAAVAGVLLVRTRTAPAAVTVRDRWTDVIGTGAILGGVGAIIAATVHVSWSTTVVIFDASAKVSVSAGAVLVGGFLIGALTAIIGHAWANRSLSALGIRVPTVVGEAARALGIGFGIPAAVAALALVIFELVKAGFTGGVAVILGTLPLQVVWADALGVFGSVNVSGIGSVQSVSTAHTGSWLWLTVVLSVSSVLLTARARWVRAGRVRPWQEAWATPVVAAVAGVLAVWLTGMSAGWSGQALTSGESGTGASVRLSGAVIVLAALAGAVAEILERYTGPYLVAYTAAVHLPGRPVSTATPASVGDGAPVAPTVRPIKVSRPVGWTIVGVLTLAVLVIAGRAVLNATVFTPQAPVTAYVNELNAGHVQAAFKIADPNVPSASRALLTDDAYGKVKDRPTGMHVTKVSPYKGGATVTVEGKQAGQTVTQLFTVAAEGSKDVLFTKWVIKNPPVNTLSAQGIGLMQNATLLVDGVSFPVSDTIYVLPGTYDLAFGIDSDHQGWFTSTTSAYEVRADQSSASLAGTPAVSKLKYELTDHAKDVATTLARKQVDQCMASTSLNFPGCDLQNSSYTYDYDVSNVKWSLVGDPTYKITAASPDAVDVLVTGDAQATYDVAPGWFDAGGTKTKTASMEYTVHLALYHGDLVLQDSGE